MNILKNEQMYKVKLEHLADEHISSRTEDQMIDEQRYRIFEQVRR